MVSHIYVGIVDGLITYRCPGHKWSPEFPFWLTAIGFILTALGSWLFYETFRENTFAAPVVKIQEERKQQVISTGVYGFVGHPLYLGAALYVLGGALLMGSLFGLLAGRFL